MENGEEDVESEEEEEKVTKPVKKKTSPKNVKKEDLALPTERSRTLPKWMQGASKRVNIKSPVKNQVQSPPKRPTGELSVNFFYICHYI